MCLAKGAPGAGGAFSTHTVVVATAWCAREGRHSPVRLVDVRNLRHERVVRVGVCQQRADGEQHLRACVRFSERHLLGDGSLHLSRQKNRAAETPSGCVPASVLRAALHAAGRAAQAAQERA